MNYQDYLKRKTAQYGDKFDPSDLAPAFVPFFENGQRIEVDLNGEIKRGTVGITTGWRPVFLLVLTKRSLGSSWTLDPSCKILKVIK
jgi:hypothetical protein